MHQKSQEEIRWLTLGEAADRLNVHRTTLRRWADEGQIPFMLTPGGHRRFAESDVDHLSSRRQPAGRMGPVERMWASQALEKVRTQLAARSGEDWVEQHDGNARSRGRELGQQLMELALRYLTVDLEGDDLTADAHKLGSRYGKHAHELGMPLSQALQVSMYFRDALVSAAIELPENVRIPLSSQTRLLGRINRLLNTVQLGVAKAYEEEALGGPSARD
ncbi:MAG: helix-turn-helix domain-containing protein [Candidatus Latescibacterota bacterium]|jgi:excisionase family DNA binding protein